MRFTCRSNDRLLHSVGVRMGSNRCVTVINRGNDNGDALIGLLLNLLRPSGNRLGGAFDDVNCIPRHFRALGDRFPVAMCRMVRCCHEMSGMTSGRTIHHYLRRVRICSLHSHLVNALDNNRYRGILVTETLLNDPRLLVFSRPSANVSIGDRRRLCGFVRRLRRRNVAVVAMRRGLGFTTHGTSGVCRIVGNCNRFYGPRRCIRRCVRSGMKNTRWY